MASGLNLKKLTIPPAKLEETAKKIALEKKYWELKIIFSALDTVVSNESQNPNSFIPKDVLDYLQQIVLYSQTDTIVMSSDNDKNKAEHEEQEDLISQLLQQQKPQIPTEVREQLHSLLSQEIKSLAETFLKIHVVKLKESPLEEDKLELKNFSENNLPLGQVLQMMVEQRKQEEIQDQKLTEFTKIYLSECSAYEKELEEVRGMMNRLVGNIKTNKAEEMKKYLSHAKEQSNLLKAESRRVKREQFKAENPPELLDQMDDSFKKIQSINCFLENENYRLTELIKVYENLGPEFCDLLKNYEAIEEEIKTKEWVIEELEGSNKDLFLE